MLVPFVHEIRSFRNSRENLLWYQRWQLQRQGALPAAEIDRLIEQRQLMLLNGRPAPGPADRNGSLVGLYKQVPEPADVVVTTAPEMPIWGRTLEHAQPVPSTRRKRGPKPDMQNHNKVAEVISGYREAWAHDENLSEVCEQLDSAGVPIPKTWPRRTDGKSRSWARALEHYPYLVVKAIKDRCRMARRNIAPEG
jgi:hypothetical protein